MTIDNKLMYISIFALISAIVFLIGIFTSIKILVIGLIMSVIAVIVLNRLLPDDD